MLRKALLLGVVGLTAGAFTVSAFAGKGNDAPSGPHYNLNIIAVPPKSVCADVNGASDDCNGNGHRIFVSESGQTKIMLGNSGQLGSYYVTDWNGTDGYAEFFLPNPDPNCTGTTLYSVYARALGNSGGASMKTCAWDIDEAVEYCSSGGDVLVFDRNSNNGKSTFTNVSRELLYVSVGGKRYPLFGDGNADYYWYYDNNGLKIAQLRFYEEPTIVDSDANTDCTFPDL